MILLLHTLINSYAIAFEFVNPRAQQFFLIRTLPKCISFLRLNGKVNAVIYKVFGVVDYESKVRISKFKIAEPTQGSPIQYFSELWICLL